MRVFLAMLLNPCKQEFLKKYWDNDKLDDFDHIQLDS